MLFATQNTAQMLAGEQYRLPVTQRRSVRGNIPGCITLTQWVPAAEEMVREEEEGGGSGKRRRKYQL